MIDLGQDQLRMVRDILRAHVSGSRAFAFGSRVHGTARPFSDLDLVVQSDAPLELVRLGALRSAFSESDLPIKVDVVDWSQLSPAFQRAIEREMIPVYP